MSASTNIAVATDKVLRERERQRRYRERHPERCRQRNRDNYALNKDRYKAKHAIANNLLYLRKRKQIREAQRVYRLNNLAARKAKDASYRSNPEVREKRKLKCKDWNQAHKHDPAFKSRRQIKGRAHYQKNKSTISKQHQAWRKSHPVECACFRMERRSLERKAAINLKSMLNWMKSVKSKPAAVCYYCGTTIPTKKIHFDHIVPLIKGGEHRVENLCVSCQSCNLSKGRNTPQAWVRIGQQVLEL